MTRAAHGRFVPSQHDACREREVRRRDGERIGLWATVGERVGCCATRIVVGASALRAHARRGWQKRIIGLRLVLAKRTDKLVDGQAARCLLVLAGDACDGRCSCEGAGRGWARARGDRAGVVGKKLKRTKRGGHATDRQHRQHRTDIVSVRRASGRT